MKKPKTDRLLKGIIGTSFAITSLTACSTSSQQELFTAPSEDHTSQASTPVSPPSPDEADCDTWKWDAENEVYQCVQEGSAHHGHYYHGGSWFPTIAAFMAGQAMGRSAGSTQVRQDTTNSNQQRVNSTNQQRTNQQVSSPNTSQTGSSNQVSNARSGMGGGGVFGG